MKKTRVLVKVGTNVLTRENGRLDYNIITDLVDQIVNLRKDHEVIFVSSGAAGAGREVFDFNNVKDPIIKKQMLASVGQGRLFQIYSDLFRENQIYPAQALLIRDDFRSKSAFQNMQTTLEALLAEKVIPIINENDLVSSEASTFGDNDYLAALTAIMMKVDLMVILSDIEGFFTADPSQDKNATLIPKVEKVSEDLLALCQDSMSSGGTGGMLSKLKAAEFAASYGIPTIVTSGKKDGTLLKAVQQKEGGTYFKAGKKKELSPTSHWMNSSAEIQGTITIDQGAKEALENNKSLLAVGVATISGEFKKRDVLLIQTEDKIRIGVGLAEAPSKEMQGWISEKEKNKIIIHTNHLFTL